MKTRLSGETGVIGKPSYWELIEFVDEVAAWLEDAGDQGIDDLILNCQSLARDAKRLATSARHGK